MNREQLVRAVADRLRSRRGGIDEILDAAFNIIIDSLVQGENVALRGFGTFVCIIRSVHGKNIVTGERHILHNQRGVRFRSHRLSTIYKLDE